MLSLEPLLMDHLDALDGFKGVHGLPELISADRATRPSPCLYVVYDGYRPLESTARGQAAKIETSWLVVVSVKHAAKSAEGGPARLSASPLVKATLKHLMGWQATEGYTPLVLAPAPRPDFSDGILLFPLAFKTIQVIKAD